jgi:hypothetical protein
LQPLLAAAADMARLWVVAATTSEKELLWLMTCRACHFLIEKIRGPTLALDDPEELEKMLKE